MDRETRDTIVGLINGYGLLFQTLINRLHANGALARPELCDELEALAARLVIEWTDHPQVFNVSVIRSLIVSLREQDRGPPYELPISATRPTTEQIANDNPEVRRPLFTPGELNSGNRVSDLNH